MVTVPVNGHARTAAKSVAAALLGVADLTNLAGCSEAERTADAAALKAAARKLDELLALDDDEVDAMVEDYKARRKAPNS